MTYRIRWSADALTDLERLFDFVLDREMTREGGDAALAEMCIAAIQASMLTLERSPFICRKAATSVFLREHVIAFGRTGFVALFEIVDETTIEIAAVRHQREDDFH